MKHLTTTLLLLSLLTPVWLSANSATAFCERQFQDPTVENRPLAFYDWLNGYVDREQLVYELEQMKDKGMQGAFIWDVGALMDKEKSIPVGPEFLKEESLQSIGLALDKAAELGLNMGLIASSSWNAGGPWIDEARAAKELLQATATVTGPGQRRIAVPAPKLRPSAPERTALLAAVAVPRSAEKRIDYASDQVRVLEVPDAGAEAIEWSVPAGEWEVLFFFQANTGQHLVCPSPNSSGLMIDHLSGPATKLHFDTILERLATVSTEEARLKYLEVDSYEVWPATDWTPVFIDTFRTRYGYDPVPYLPLLKNYQSTNGELAGRFRNDYTKLVSDLMIENHFAQGSEIARENDMLLFAEAGHGGYPRVDPLKAFGAVDVPMGELWNRQRHWVTKEAASGAHIYGKKLVASESLTGWNHWQHGPADFKQLLDIGFCEGLNQIVFHTFSHNPKVVGKPGAAYHAGEHINVNTTWWEMSRPFMDYLSRCSYMLRQGTFVADVLVYYGNDAPNLEPPRRIDPHYTPEMRGVRPAWWGDESKCLHCGQLKTVDPGDLLGYAYDYVNEDVILNHMQAGEGRLNLDSGTSYRVLLLPDRDAISLPVLRRLEQLVQDGAVIIGPRPNRARSLKDFPANDAEVRAIGERMWGPCDGKRIRSHRYGKGMVYWGRTVKEVLAAHDIGPDFQVRGIDNADRTIDYIHHRSEDEEFYFVSNSSESVQEVTCVFRVAPDRVPELWDAVSGAMQRRVDYRVVEGGIEIDFIMDPLASRFVLFREAAPTGEDSGLSVDLQYGLHRAKPHPELPEGIDLSTDWTVRFAPDWGAPESQVFDRLRSWTEMDEKGIQFFSGKATYSREFTLPAQALAKGAKAYLSFDDIQETARIFINGQDCGILWTPPYLAEITPHLQPGDNTIQVEVINTWNNRIVGDLRHPEQKPFTRTNAKVKFNAKSQLLDSGLIGDARIHIFQKQSTE